MSARAEIRRAVTKDLDHSELARIMTEMVDIPSPTGHEEEMSRYLASKFHELGMDARFQGVEADRENVICSLPGAGGGPSVMLNGHMDAGLGTERDRVAARREGDWIVGTGASNMKPLFAAAYMAIRMLRDANVKLKGSVSVTGVVGEIEMGAVDSYQGLEFRGGGLGSMHLAGAGASADYCIIGEPTGLRVQMGNTGYTFAKIRATGRAAHTWNKQFGTSAIDKVFEIKKAVEEWEPFYQDAHPHKLMKPRLTVGGIHGGVPFSPSQVPGECSLYVHICTLPNQKSQDLLNEMKAFLDKRGLSAEVEFFWVRRGYEIPVDHKLVRTLERDHEEVTGTKPAFPEPYRFCVSSDGPFFHENGTPTVTYGAGGITTTGKYSNQDETYHTEVLSLKNLETCAKVYALALIDLCGVA